MNTLYWFTIVLLFGLIGIFSLIVDGCEMHEKKNTATTATAAFSSPDSPVIPSHSSSGIASRSLIDYSSIYYGKTAICPVRQVSITIGPSTPFIQFSFGQRLYFCCEKCIDSFLANPHQYLTNPQQGIVYEYQPNVIGSHLPCVECGKEIAITSSTPRVQFKGGQSLYFVCYRCINEFLENPLKYIDEEIHNKKTMESLSDNDNQMENKGEARIGGLPSMNAVHSRPSHA